MQLLLYPPENKKKRIRWMGHVHTIEGHLGGIRKKGRPRFDDIESDLRSLGPRGWRGRGQVGLEEDN